jgi:hypothetical protein
MKWAEKDFKELRSSSFRDAQLSAKEVQAMNEKLYRRLRVIFMDGIPGKVKGKWKKPKSVRGSRDRGGDHPGRQGLRFMVPPWGDHSIQPKGGRR